MFSCTKPVATKEDICLVLKKLNRIEKRLNQLEDAKAEENGEGRARKDIPKVVDPNNPYFPLFNYKEKIRKSCFILLGSEGSTNDKNCKVIKIDDDADVGEIEKFLKELSQKKAENKDEADKAKEKSETPESENEKSEEKEPEDEPEEEPADNKKKPADDKKKPAEDKKKPADDKKKAASPAKNTVDGGGESGQKTPAKKPSPRASPTKEKK